MAWGLQVVVVEHDIGHGLQQLVALLVRHVAVGDDIVEHDLDVDLVIGAVDASGVVDEVRVHATAGLREPDAAALRDA